MLHATHHSPPVPPSRVGVIAVLDETGEVLGTLTYGIGPGDHVVRSTDYSVLPEHRRKGVGVALARGLFDTYPDCEVAEGGGSNSSDGTGFLAGLRSRGLPYHLWECFLEGGCCCALEGRRRS